MNTIEKIKTDNIFGFTRIKFFFQSNQYVQFSVENVDTEIVSFSFQEFLKFLKTNDLKLNYNLNKEEFEVETHEIGCFEEIIKWFQDSDSRKILFDDILVCINSEIEKGQKEYQKEYYDWD